MVRAPVPEASIDEDRDAGGSEDDVYSTTIPQHWAIHSESEATSVERPPQRNFSAGVPATHPRHALAGLGRRRLIVGGRRSRES